MSVSAAKTLGGYGCSGVRVWGGASIDVVREITLCQGPSKVQHSRTLGNGVFLYLAGAEIQNA